MGKREDISQKRREAGQKSVTHRMVAFRNRGEDALTPAQAGYFAIIREQFRSQPGRMEYREQLAASLAMLCELGFSHLREHAEKGVSIWDTDVIKRLGTYINSLTRLLDNWPKEDGGPKNIIDVLKGGENAPED
jgi:hypothetical protein